ncbi:hypothetical protein [Marinimicrobium sp. ABcell2]|uniref:hypothetical protein n=1 Tax=Marinimicrobium sp. ABcell2 TaxID=3069751 RepID=UPI0027B2B150|nr:hypothetical protein [Marinimicrobium sp. ABcell2]MDQ2076023.1 hypothetical protein [Marinimicrobium sp. ABcell2]
MFRLSCFIVFAVLLSACTSVDPATPAFPSYASAGCSADAQGNSQLPDTLITWPSDYDGATPKPLVLVFHGRNRDAQQMREQDARTLGSELEEHYILAFVKSAASGYVLEDDYPRVKAIRADILATSCVDTRAVFAMGLSNGAQFIAQILGDDSEQEHLFDGIAVVASSYQNPPWEPIPSLVIHGLNDTVREGIDDADGSKDIVQFVTSNQCAESTRPIQAASCRSLTGGGVVNPGCVEYQQCGARTIFCNHDDPHYSDTNHGWPCFANNKIFEFFESLR